MEAKFLASALSFLSIFLAIYAQSFANNLANESDETAEEFALATTPVIYYGDSNVNIGESFEITCIIPITEKVHWLKNGESINRHNLRHGHDDHSYSLSETAIEGEKHKIEAILKVRHALKVHEGRYQCNSNSRHGNGYHMLHVRSGKSQSATESGYQTIDELTPSSPDEIFTPTWQEQQHQQQSHKQHKQLSAQHSPSYPTDPVAAGGYINATAYGYGFGYERPAHPAHPAPTSKYPHNDLTTLPWHTSSQGAGAGVPPVGIRRLYSATPPDFPPPRFSLEHTVAPPEPPTIQLFNQTLHHHHQLDTATDSSSPATSSSSSSATMGSATTVFNTAHHHAHHQQQLQQQAQHTLNTLQLPMPPPHQPHQPHQPMSQHPVHSHEKDQTFMPHFVQPALGTVTSVPDASLTTGSNNNNVASMQQQPKTILPIKKGSDSLEPNYDHADGELKFYDIRSPLVLSCNVKNDDSDSPLVWKKDNVSVTDVASLRGRYKLLSAEKKFIIERAEPHDDGKYSCEYKGVSRNINAIARVVVRVPSNTGVVEGEKMTVTCAVVGTRPRLSWSFANFQNMTKSTGRYILKADDNNVENAVLMVENVTLEDRGDYTCYGRNEINDVRPNSTVATDFTTVRVKGKFAALWPFLGICAEVLILCLIILIYEKRRNKSELEESDTDPQEQKKKRRNYD